MSVAGIVILSMSNNVISKPARRPSSATVAAEIVAELKAYAKEAGIVIWLSLSTTDEVTEVPQDIADIADMVIYLEQKSDATVMNVSKNRENGANDILLKLDTKTLLMAEK